MFFIAFLLTHPVWDVTPFLGLCDVLKLISTHTSRVGCDVRRSRNFYGVSHFYSHIPCGMWHGLFYLHFCIVVNFYSHIPCGMWRKAALELYYDKTISTHTSRVGCDTVEQWHQYITGGISTHTSRVGCDYFSNHPSDRFFLYFYSHIPCGMWLVRPNFKPIIIPISTHTSRVGCDILVMKTHTNHIISTHTSRVGCDSILKTTQFIDTKFLLTHPVWDVTMILIRWNWFLTISTHTSRVGCDVS